MRACRYILYFLALFAGTDQVLTAQNLPVPDGRRLRDIVTENYPEGKLLIGGTTGSWGFTNPVGELMDREFSYVTPENDFKHSVIRSDPKSWNWDRADAWLQHILDQGQVLRMHGPIAPQCSNWAKEDLRTAEELSEELDTFMTALCQRYNGVEGILYLDVVNEIALPDGSWLGAKPGTDQWENPWFKIGQDTDPNHTPLYVSQAFEIANEHAPDLKQILNNHCHPGTAGMERVKETILYLRERGYRVDGLGWQAHVDVGWATEDNLQELREVIDWCQERDLEFHMTEFDAWITNPYTQTLEDQAYTYQSIMDVLIEKLDSLTIGWNTWHITDAAGWKPERKPAVFDEKYRPKPAYYALQLALETQGDYSTPHELNIQVRNSKTGEAIKGCELSLNGESGTSDQNGELTFQSLGAGRYTLEASAEHMDPLRKKVSIYKDTVLAVYLDPALYEVSYQISVENKDVLLSGVEVTIDSLIRTSDLSGTVTFSLQAGTYQVEFSRTGFENLLLEHEVLSDTSLEIFMTKTHGYIKFRLRNEGIPVNDAQVVLENDTLMSNAVGICTFELLSLDRFYSYKVSKDNYYDLSGELFLSNDTTLDLQFSKSVANVTFQLDEKSLDALGAYVILASDSSWFDKEGRARFYKLPLDREFQYQILSENYPDFSASLFLVKDTTVLVSLTNTGIQKKTAEFDCRIFPNPAGDLLNIWSSDELASIKFLSVNGFLLKRIQVLGKEKKVDISDLKPGSYWLILIRSDGSEEYRALVKN